MQVRRRLAVVCVAVVVGLALTSIGCSTPGTPADPAKHNQASKAQAPKAPDFKATTLADKEFELEDLRGRVVLLNFWATWCKYCGQEVLQLEKLWKKYKDKGLVVIGIAGESGSDEEVRKFAADNKLTYWMVNDKSGAIAREYGIRPIPTTYILSPQGVITRAYISFGPGLEKQFDKEIKRLLPTPAQLKKLKPLDE